MAESVPSIVAVVAAHGVAFSKLTVILVLIFRSMIFVNDSIRVLAQELVASSSTLGKSNESKEGKEREKVGKAQHDD